MPFAQWGYPRTGHDEFDASFPADFISEAIDQTRGWFYSLLMISTLVFDEARARCPVADPHPYKTCIVLGHVTDKEGKKESKSKGNYTPPEVILEKVAMEFAAISGKDARRRASAEGSRVHRARGPRRARPPSGREGSRLRARLTRDHVVELAVEPRQEAFRVAWSSSPTRSSRDSGCRSRPRGVKLLPVDVPRLPAEERVTIDDPATPAPGADAFRWFFFASNPPWTNTRHSLGNVRALQKEFPIKLRNVYSFFTIYANIDDFDPVTEKGRPISQRSFSIDGFFRSSSELERKCIAVPRRRISRTRRRGRSPISWTRSRTGT